MSGQSGIAPIVDPRVGATALCAHCATLIRYHALVFAWRHAIVAQGLDHAPEPVTPPPGRGSNTPAPELTESEQRALWGDR